MKLPRLKAWDSRIIRVLHSPFFAGQLAERVGKWDSIHTDTLDNDPDSRIWGISARPVFRGERQWSKTPKYDKMDGQEPHGKRGGSE